MELQRKALYNLLQINRLPDKEFTMPDGRVLESWQMENYRDWSDHRLIQGLREMNIGLELSDFHAFANNYDSPEDMADSLAGDMDYICQDKAYLLTFELWRRYLPEKQSISIFCDELDYQILLYDQGKTKTPAHIQDALAYLQYILDEHVDGGIDPFSAFDHIQNYCANDLESFLYDYILEEIEAGNDIYAMELLDGFYRYMANSSWFDFLRVQLELSKETEESIQQLHQFIEELQEEKQLQLHLEVLQFLAKRSDRYHFIPLAAKTLQLLQLEEDFQDFLSICQTFFQESSRHEESKIIERILEERSTKPLNEPVKKSDPGLTQLTALLKK